MTLRELKRDWQDAEYYHTHICELFTGLVNKDDDLRSHRDWVQGNIWGFGEKPFWYLWNILLSELPDDASLLEIGVFRGATLSVWRLLKPYASIYGVTPLSTSGGMWESDYRADIEQIHNEFDQPQPYIIEGLSQEKEAIANASDHAPYDVLYVDGLHTYDGCLADLVNYCPMVKSGGYLVVDDACTDMHMKFGYFQGIDTVTNATLDYLKKYGFDWEFMFNVVHLRIYRRV